MLMWFNKSVITINVMFKILDITSLRFIYIYIYSINLDLEQVLSIQTCVFPLSKCTKINRSGSKWIELDQMDRIGPNGPK